MKIALYQIDFIVITRMRTACMYWRFTWTASYKFINNLFIAKSLRTVGAYLLVVRGEKYEGDAPIAW